MKIQEKYPKGKTQKLDSLNNSIVYKKDKMTIFDK